MKLIRVLILSAILVSCATQQTAPPPPATKETQALWEKNRTRLNAITTWHMNGRIAIVTEKGNWDANVHWQQHVSTYELIFKAPLGQSTMSLEGRANRVVMHTSEGETFVESNPDRLIAKTMDIVIPVTGLQFWIRGIPAPQPAPAQYLLNETGYLYSLQQDGWTISYKRYTDIANLKLPDKIFLENGRFKVKIAVSQWNLPSSPNKGISQLSRETTVIPTNE